MLLTIDPDDRFHDAVEERALEAGLQGGTVRAASAAVVDDLLNRSGLPIRAVLLGPGLSQDDISAHLERLRAGDRALIILQVAVPTTTTLRAALRAGISDVLPPHHTGAELVEALQQAGYGDSATSQQLPGRTIAVFSAKGGVGTSVLASNLALRLSDHTGAPAILADLDLASADQAVLHGLRPRFTVQDVVNGALGGDVESLDQVLLPVPDTDVRVLPGPLDPAAAETIHDAAILDVLHHLRALVGLVVVDTASAFTDVTLTVLEHADVIVLPVSLDVLSLRATKVTLQTFDRLGIDREQVMLVGVRADAKVGLTIDDVVRTTGSTIHVAIPSSRDVARSINTASPLALSSPRSGVVRAIDELVEMLLAGVDVHGAVEGADGSSLRGLLGRRKATDPTPAMTPADVGPASSGTTGDAVKPGSLAGIPPLDVPNADESTDTVSSSPARDVDIESRAPRRVRSRTVRPARHESQETGTTPIVSDQDDQSDDADGGDGPVAQVIPIVDQSERLAAMPPPQLDGVPAIASEPEGRGRRKNARN